jgi:phosphate transport system permease protein
MSTLTRTYEPSVQDRRLQAPPSSGTWDGSPQIRETSKRPKAFGLTTLWELGGSAAAALAIVWVAFSVAGLQIEWSWFSINEASAALSFYLSCLLVFFIIYTIVCWRLHGVLVMKDRLATVVLWAGGLVALIPLGALIVYVCVQGGSVALARFPHFFVADMSQATPTNPVTDTGAGAAIVGTVEQVGLATVVTVPLGIMAAMYLVDHKGVFSRAVSSVVDATTGAPAIITGLFIYLLWVKPRGVNGKSGLAAAMALAVMMLPWVIRASYEVITVVPGSLREAALALGAPKWRVMLRVVLPTARAGIATAIILAIARVAGETAPVLFNAGGNAHYNWNPFSGYQDNLPLRIYELIFEGQKNFTREAWGVSFVLILLVCILFIVARIAGASRPGRSLAPWALMRNFHMRSPLTRMVDRSSKKTLLSQRSHSS